MGKHAIANPAMINTKKERERELRSRQSGKGREREERLSGKKKTERAAKTLILIK